MTGAPGAGAGAGSDVPPSSDVAALELLERALAYLRGRLVGVTPAHLDAPTPCLRWDLHDLLVHLDDLLDALLEAGSGRVGLVPGGHAAPIAVPTTPTGPCVAVMQRKVGAVLGALVDAWGHPSAGVGRVAVGGMPLDRVVLAQAAALEVAVHGWDVGVATGRAVALPEPLAAALLPAARMLVDDAVRGDPRTGTHPFGPAVRASPRVAVDPGPKGPQLLAHVGRRPAPGAGQVGDSGQLGQFGQSEDAGPGCS